MAGYLFVMWDGGGNVSPFLALGGHLIDRGHQVGAVATAGLGERLATAGIDVVATSTGWLPQADDVTTGVAAFDPDLVVVDFMLTAALCGAERAGAPTVALVHTLYRELLRDGAPSPMDMAGPVRAVNETRRALGLPAVTAYRELLDATDAVLVTAPDGLDAPGDVPDRVHYVGALIEGPGPDAGWQPPGGDGPLVAVSMGTAGDPTAETAVLRTILAALATLPVRGFLTVPRYLDRAGFDLPANVTISGYVRHAAVLPHADVLVTHAGLGSVLAALAHGVPIVALPLDRDQPDNARAVVRIGAGTALSPDAGVDDVRAAITAELDRTDPVRLAPDPGPAIDLLEAIARAGPSR
jgi:MGT family glycosyltransferase